MHNNHHLQSDGLQENMASTSVHSCPVILSAKKETCPTNTEEPIHVLSTASVVCSTGYIHVDVLLTFRTGHLARRLAHMTTKIDDVWFGSICLGEGLSRAGGH